MLKERKKDRKTEGERFSETKYFKDKTDWQELGLSESSLANPLQTELTGRKIDWTWVSLEEIRAV